MRDPLGHRRQVRGGIGVGLAPPGLGRVLARGARYSEDPLGRRVVGLQVCVTDGPAGARVADEVAVHLEIPLAKAKRHPAIEDRGTADTIVGAQVAAAPQLAVGRLPGVMTRQLADILLGPVLRAREPPSRRAPAAAHATRRAPAPGPPSPRRIRCRRRSRRTSRACRSCRFHGPEVSRDGARKQPGARTNGFPPGGPSPLPFPTSHDRAAHPRRAGPPGPGRRGARRRAAAAQTPRTPRLPRVRPRPADSIGATRCSPSSGPISTRAMPEPR